MINESIENICKEYFPNIDVSFFETDSDLMDILKNFIFVDVLKNSNLDKKTSFMVTLSSLIAQNTLSAYKIFLDGALDNNVTPTEIKEILYQAVPYVGIAKVLDFIEATNIILKNRGVKLPLKDKSTINMDTRFNKGLKVQKSIFGDVIDDMYKSTPKNQMHITEFLSSNCFGDFYTRNGLDIQIRELLTFAIILSLGGCESQLMGHIQGNVNVGNDKKTLISVITQLLPYNGYPRTLNALQCLNQVIPEE